MVMFLFVTLMVILRSLNVLHSAKNLRIVSKSILFNHREIFCWFWRIQGGPVYYTDEFINDDFEDDIEDVNVLEDEFKQEQDQDQEQSQLQELGQE